jgi:hypothetical protein
MAVQRLLSRLNDPQLVEQTRPMAVQPFEFAFRASAVVPRLIARGVVDIHA